LPPEALRVKWMNDLTTYSKIVRDKMAESKETIRDTVRKGYSEIAAGSSGCCCGGSSPDKLAGAIGYTAEELEMLPEGANMGLSCGNPTAMADLKPGQVVLDLGSGGGFDVFIAARKVGPEGKAIGVDMTPDMLSKARAGISVFTEKTGLANVEFRLGEIEHLPVADNSVDVVISNCVINLSPDKQQVWHEIARVLKPGGKACISDLALKKPLPKELLESAAALVSCVAGAVLVEETQTMATQANLCDIEIDEKESGFDILTDCNDPLYRQVKECLPEGVRLSDYIVSVNVTAFKKQA
jgi:SAM-dependent methyltransferase